MSERDTGIAFRLFADVFAAAIEGLGGERPRWSHSSFEDTSTLSDLVWWSCTVHPLEDEVLLLGAPPHVWAQLAAWIAAGAGLDANHPETAGALIQELLSQTFTRFAREVGRNLLREVSAGAPQPTEDPSSTASYTRLDLGLRAGKAAAFVVGIGPQLARLLCGQAASDPPGAALVGPSTAAHRDTPLPGGWAGKIDRLAGLELPLVVSLGKARLPLREVLQLNVGSVVELGRAVAEPVDLLVNNRLVARGEVVVIDGNYGIRIQTVADRTVRLGGLA